LPLMVQSWIFGLRQMVWLPEGKLQYWISPSSHNILGYLKNKRSAQQKQSNALFYFYINCDLQQDVTPPLVLKT
jgi:hypothetical protein